MNCMGLVLIWCQELLCIQAFEIFLDCRTVSVDSWRSLETEVSFADLKNIINMCAEGREIYQSNQKFLILSALHESLWGLKCSMIIIMIILLLLLLL